MLSLNSIGVTSPTALVRDTRAVEMPQDEAALRADVGLVLLIVYGLNIASVLLRWFPVLGREGGCASGGHLGASSISIADGFDAPRLLPCSG